MKKLALSLVALLSFSALSFAQSNVADKQGFKNAEDSINYVKNTAYYKTYKKSNNYIDAYAFWKKIYDNYPAQTKDIYIDGVDILKDNIEHAKTPQDKQKYIDELMGVYDNRIKYFGDDPDYGIDYILGSKIDDYIKYFGEKADYAKVYEWLKPVVAEKKQQTDPLSLYYYSYSSLVKLSMDPNHKDTYIKDHFMVDGFYKEAIAAAQAAGDSKKEQNYTSFMQSAEAAFAASGAADCATMEKIYAPQIAEKKTDKEFLSTVLNLLAGVGCTESDLYFAASEAMYELEPSASAALGIAGKAFKEGNTARAEKYYNEAISLSKDASEKGEVYYILATMAYKRGQYGTARSYANSAMANKKGFGAPMLLIANMYAASAKSIYPDDPIRQRIVYCLVVDKASQAKAIDPSISGEANQVINRYAAYYPAKEDIFMHPDLKAGQSFTVGGWIGETTTIRVK